MKNYHQINEAVKHGDFTEFDMLNEDEQKQYQKQWDQKTWLQYMSNEPYISDDDLFKELYNIIDNAKK